MARAPGAATGKPRGRSLPHPPTSRVHFDPVVKVEQQQGGEGGSQQKVPRHLAQPALAWLLGKYPSYAGPGALQPECACRRRFDAPVAEWERFIEAKDLKPARPGSRDAGRSPWVWRDRTRGRTRMSHRPYLRRGAAGAAGQTLPRGSRGCWLRCLSSPSCCGAPRGARRRTSCLMLCRV